MKPKQMENMHLNEGDVIHLRSASLLKGSFVKLQPQTSDFTLISNPKAVLEKSLGSFSALTKGETFRIFYNNKKYNIGVVEVRPEGGRFPSNSPEAVCIIEADVQVDFEAPADYVEPPRPSPPQSSPLSSPPLTKSPLVGPSLGNPRIDNDSSDEEMTCKPKFTGSGFRLDGKPIKTPKYSGGKNSSADTLNGGCDSTAPKLSVRIGGDGSLIGGSENALGARDTASNAGTGTTTTAGAGTGTGSGNSVLGRTLSGATVPLPDLSANQEQDGRGEIGSEMRCLGLRGATSSASDTAHHRTPDSDANNSASDGLALERIGSHADAIKRLGKAAETPARGDAYWASLGIGKKIRD